ncbi:MAG: amino acid ABC transporter substrate-binding protein [Gammaproteobacteria bacterium]|nr:amino acid ABC transporter substrate-binding protein [Gammaproteobacteria bacterium]
MSSAACAESKEKPTFTPDTVESMSLEELLKVVVPGNYNGKGIYQSPQNPITEDTINFAVLMPLGYFPNYSASMFAAADLAVERINESGGINGKKVAIIRADITHSRQSSVEFSRLLVENYNASAIFGPGSTEAVREVMENVSIPFKIPLVTTSASSMSLQSIDPDTLFWQLSANNKQQAEAMVRLLKQQGRYKRIALVSGRGIYGQELSYSIRNMLPNSSFLEFSHSSLMTLNINSVQDDISRIKLFKPDAIIFSIHSNLIEPYLKTFESHWKEKLPTLIAGDVLVKPQPNKKIAFPRIAQCLNLIVTGDSLSSNFEKELKKKLDLKNLEIETASLYDSVILMALAIEKQSNSGRPLKQIMHEITSGNSPFDGLNLNSARKSNKGLNSFHYIGASGRVKFDANGANDFAKINIEKYLYNSKSKCQ